MPLPKTEGKPQSRYGAKWGDEEYGPPKEYEDDMVTGARRVIRSRAKARASKGDTRAAWLKDADEYQRDVQQGAEGGMRARRAQAQKARAKKRTVSKSR